MKFLIVLLIPGFLYAQDELVTYRKHNGEIASHRDSAAYIRIIKAPHSGSELPQLSEYYLDKQLKKTGNILDAKRHPQFHGAVTEYYENGQESAQEIFDKGRRVGKASYYYQNGQLKKEVIYSRQPDLNAFAHPVPDTLVNYYDSLGTAWVSAGNGYVKEIEGEDHEEGHYRDGLRDGEWTGTFHERRYSFTENYQNGVVVSGVSEDGEGNSFTYAEIGTPPVYEGGMMKLMQFIGQHYRYPPAAIRAGVQGTVQLQFVVDRDGTVTDIQITRDLGHGTGEEAVNVLKKAPKWTPGYQRGVPVRVSYALPIRLNL
ncbi:TonB family protein [Parapedobacter sp. GCM10030251]|uniref:TonB family protein n=1 Tax=Parapedobacter sp. GCM10030251 TaxID=3273419 RepID=UPI003623ECA1